ncbi:unnamed protein product [Clonostachys chloroleuca]|uniref:Endonuclease/exonuclease/phosphatase domain-containing protein n=1 Tax=Clonostachys chloroleuca TaxID=1926264 RepID=A0AA35M7D7_9HYPO|nr:unnamed protein product [Clonostachys chloroleuca]
MQILVATLAFVAAAQATTINAINGRNFLSPFNGQSVTNVTGIVTAKTSTGVYLRAPRRTCDKRIGTGLYVFSPTLGKNASISVGDTLVLDGKVTEYRSNTAYLYSTELESPVVQGWVKGTTTPKPRVIGKDTHNPPTEQYSILDNGDIYGVPNNVSQVSIANPELQPAKYGLDFWKMLNGELVTIQNPIAVSKPNTYGETWMIGNWPTTGQNKRGGLTLSDKDANPEAVMIGSPLDGSKAVTTSRIGDKFDDITGVVHYQFGFYYILPLTAIKTISSLSPALPPPTSLISTGECSGLTVGDYNIENFAPSDTAHVNAVAAHIVNYMKSPDVLFIQEVQDNNGATNNGEVDSSMTLSTLTAAITKLGGVNYSYTWINPLNNADGGQPGGNIRQAYLYNPNIVRLHNENAGSATDANAVVKGANGSPTLKYNPGRIDPANAAWVSSRKPLVAEWQTVVGNHVFFTVNVHWESKGGSSSLQGDLRPPVNSPVEKRTLQANLTGSFIADILAIDSDARVIMAGDLNEYSVVQPVKTFTSVSSMVDLDVAAGIPVNERYTYTFGADMEELDHLFVSPAIANLHPLEEHIHVNTWVSYADQVSDHDPTVAKINVCGNNVASSNVTMSLSSTPAATPTSTLTPVSSGISTPATTAASGTRTTSPSSSSVSATATPIASGKALSGRGNVLASTPGESTGGRLLTSGNWYRAGGTAAIFTATPNVDGITFTLQSSKGKCAIVADMSIFCDSSVTPGSSFGWDGAYVTYLGANSFYATELPTGSGNTKVYTTEKALTLQLTWSAL